MCIFCKIINSEIPSYRIYEDEEVIAILDISQTTTGHTLVIPKKHFNNFLEADEKTINNCMKIVKMLCEKYQIKLLAKGFNILTNINEVSGQTVNHLHFHIIPRYDFDDKITISFNNNNKEDLQKIFQKIND